MVQELHVWPHGSKMCMHSYTHKQCIHSLSVFCLHQVVSKCESNIINSLWKHGGIYLRIQKRSSFSPNARTSANNADARTMYGTACFPAVHHQAWQKDYDVHCQLLWDWSALHCYGYLLLDRVQLTSKLPPKWIMNLASAIQWTEHLVERQFSGSQDEYDS